MQELDTDAVVMTHTCCGSEPESLISSPYLSHYIYEGHPFRNVSTVRTHAERSGWELMIKASSCCIYHKEGAITQCYCVCTSPCSAGRQRLLIKRQLLGSSTKS